MKRKFPLRKVSKLKHRIAKLRIPKDIKDALLERSGGVCERLYWFDGSLSLRCVRTGSEPHHKLKRSQGGDHSLSNLLWLCHKCHRDTELYPASCVEDEVLIPWKGYRHPQDFEDYKQSKGIK